MGKSEIEFIPSEFTKHLTLAFAPAIKAGFPSPAEAYEVEPLDFNKDLVTHPDTTFYARVMGDSMIGAGINPGDLLVIERSIEPLMALSSDNAIQTNFADFDAEKYKKMRKLDVVVDKINRHDGTETVVLGSQQYTAKARQSISPML